MAPRVEKALASKGSQDKTYLKLRQQISDELMNIRFTSRSIERLCDSVRGMVPTKLGTEREDCANCRPALSISPT